MISAVVIVAGGSGARFGQPRNKVFLPLGGRPILQRSIETMHACQSVETVVVVCRPEDAHLVEALDPEVAVVAGGPTRHGSETNGIESLAGMGLDVIAVHDAARPLASVRLTEEIIRTAHRVGGAVPFLSLDQPVFDRGHLLDPERHVRVQTPQAFRAGPLVDAYRRARAAGFQGVDTAETVERYSELKVALVPGEPHNLKITYAEDIATAEKSLA